jgi:hypothetical protein
MAELDKKDPVSLTELMVSTLAMADAVTKLLIEKGVITEQKLLEERAIYQKLLTPPSNEPRRLSHLGSNQTLRALQLDVNAVIE